VIRTRFITVHAVFASQREAPLADELERFEREYAGTLISVTNVETNARWTTVLAVLRAPDIPVGAPV
jgi:cellulase/cellobiase CelA1